MEILSPILIILLFILVVWLIFSTSTKQKIHEAENKIEDIEEEAIPIAPPVLYQLNTDPIRYQLYSTKHLRKDTQMLYSNIILDNLWINEPFHSTVFKLLLLLDKDAYYIRDPFSKVITSNLRNDDNQMIRVESYLVLSVLDIIAYCIVDCIRLIKQFRKHDAQTITLALMLLICQKSENLLVTDLSEIKKIIFEDYPDTEKIEYILSLLKQHDERFKFIPAVYDLAVKNVSRHPYVAGTTQQKLFKCTLLLPKKVLKHCQ